eukprot:621718-Prymnesium_polylepis.2
MSSPIFHGPTFAHGRCVAGGFGAGGTGEGAGGGGTGTKHSIAPVQVRLTEMGTRSCRLRSLFQNANCRRLVNLSEAAMDSPETWTCTGRLGGEGAQSSQACGSRMAGCVCGVVPVESGKWVASRGKWEVGGPHE